MRGVTLIGMPGAGKSTIGKILAVRLEFKFVDLDVLIREKEGRSHDQISRENGDAELLRLEEQYALGLDLARTVFAPGGSIIYSPRAMEKLRDETAIVYLELPFSEIKNRLGDNAAARGIVGLKEKGLDGLFTEREPLYLSYAHHIIHCQDLSDAEIVDKCLHCLP